MRFTIAKKLWLGFGLMIALVVVIGGLSYTTSRTLQSTVNQMADRMNDLKAANELSVRSREALRAAVTYLVSPSADGERAIATTLEAARSALKKAESEIADKAMQAKLDEMHKNLDQFSGATADLVAANKSKLELFYGECGPAGIRLQTDLEQLVATAEAGSDHAAARQASEALAKANLARLGVARYLVTTDMKEFDAGAAAATECARLLETLVSGAGKSDLKSQAREAQAALKAYTDIGGRVVALSGSIAEARDQRLIPTAETIATSKEGLDEFLVKEAAGARDAAIRTIAVALVETAACVAIALAIGVIASFAIARSVAGASRALAVRMRDIAEGEGDLTQRVDDKRSDELGEVGRWFNAFVGKVQGIVSEFAAASQQVAAAATEIAASSEEMSAATGEVARQAESVTTVAQQSRELAEKGGEVIRDAVSGMRSIETSVSRSAESVSALEDRSAQIGQIIAVINEIADQTNLLALNAAIEAARAGEHGRGFAVVADEVRKLAERTTKATEQVSSTIQAIQGETRSSVERMHEGSSYVEAGVRSATLAGESLSEIIGKSKSVADMIRSVAAAAMQAGAGSEQAAGAATQLSTKAEQLQQMVRRFKV